jgi:hypothetical protein
MFFIIKLFVSIHIFLWCILYKGRRPLPRKERNKDIGTNPPPPPHETQPGWSSKFQRYRKNNVGLWRITESLQACGITKFVNFADLPQMWQFSDLPFPDQIFFCCLWICDLQFYFTNIGIKCSYYNLCRKIFSRKSSMRLNFSSFCHEIAGTGPNFWECISSSLS